MIAELFSNTLFSRDDVLDCKEAIELFKKDKLSLIVDDINKQFGTHFTEMDKVLKQIENDLVNDPELQKFAKSDRETIRIVYDRLFPNRLLARHENNKEFFQKMCSDKKFMEDIMARLFPIVLQRLTK